MAEANAQLVRDLFDAWNRGDYDAAGAPIADDIEIEMVTHSVVDGTYRGREGMAELLSFWGAFAEFRSEVTEIETEGEEVLATVHHFGRGKTSGVEVEMENWQVFTVRDDTITRYRIYGDRDEARSAAGIDS